MGQNKSKQVQPFLHSVKYNRYQDILFITTINPETHEKYKFEIPNPTVPAWFLKPEIEPAPYYKEFELLENLERKEIPVKDREFYLAKALGNDVFLQDVKEGKCDMSEIYLDRRLFGADINVEDWTIMQFMDRVENDDVPMEGNIRFGCLDIEIDSIDYKEVKVGEIHKYAKDVPVNAITYIDSHEKTCYTYALINEEYKGQKEVMANVKAFIARTIKNTMDALEKETLKKSKVAYDILKKALSELKFKVMFFDNDRDLIANCLTQVYKRSMPDFLQIYNAQFDVRFLEERMKHINLSKYEMFTHPSFKNKFVNHNYRDESIKAKERRHSYASSSFTKIIDQQIMFFGLRPQFELSPASLDNVVKHVTGIGKLSYAHICNNMLDLVRADFATFLEYNIRDVIAQYFVELCSNDLEAMMTMSYTTRSVPERAIIAMSSVNNCFMHDAMREGKMYGNEINRALKKKFKPIHDKSIRHEVKKYKEIHGKKPSDHDMKEIERLAGRNIVNFIDPKDRNNILVQMYVNLNAPRIKGGYCSDPNKLSAQGVEILPGVHSKAFHKDWVDIDAKSQYPTTMIYHNISRSALYDKVVNIEGYNGDPGRFCELVINDDVHLFGKELLSLPGLDEIATSLGLGTVQELDSFGQKIKTIQIDKTNVDYLFELNDSLKNIDKSLKDESPNAGMYSISTNDSVIYYKDGMVKYELANNNLARLYDVTTDITVDGRELQGIIKTGKKEIKAGENKFITCMCKTIDETEFLHESANGFMGKIDDYRELYTMLDNDMGSIRFNDIAKIPITLSKRHISLIDRFRKYDSRISVSLYKTDMDDMYVVKIKSHIPIKKLKDNLIVEYSFNIVA